MRLYTLIKGEELFDSIEHHDKAFSVGSRIQWGNKVWEIIEATNGCKGCYFAGNGRCYCIDTWFENLGACSAVVRADGKDVIFQLHRMEE